MELQVSNMRDVLSLASNHHNIQKQQKTNTSTQLNSLHKKNDEKNVIMKTQVLHGWTNQVSNMAISQNDQNTAHDNQVDELVLQSRHIIHSKQINKVIGGSSGYRYKLPSGMQHKKNTNAKYNTFHNLLQNKFKKLNKSQNSRKCPNLTILKQRGENSITIIPFDTKRDIAQRKHKNLVSKWINLDTKNINIVNLEATKKYIQTNFNQRIETKHLVEALQVRQILQQAYQSQSEETIKLTKIIQCIQRILKQKKAYNGNRHPQYNMYVTYIDKNGSSSVQKQKTNNSEGEICQPKIKEQSNVNNEHENFQQLIFARLNTVQSKNQTQCNQENYSQQKCRYSKLLYAENINQNQLFDQIFNNVNSYHRLSHYAERKYLSNYSKSRKYASVIQKYENKGEINMRSFDNNICTQETQQQGLEENHSQIIKNKLESNSNQNRYLKQFMVTSNAINMKVDELKQQKRKQRSLLLMRSSLNTTNQFKLNKVKKPNSNSFNYSYDQSVRNLTSKFEEKGAKYAYLKKRGGRYALVMDKLKNSQIVKQVKEALLQEEQLSGSALTNASQSDIIEQQLINDEDQTRTQNNLNIKSKGNRISGFKIDDIEREQKQAEHTKSYKNTPSITSIFNLSKGKLNGKNKKHKLSRELFNAVPTKKRAPFKKITRLNTIEAESIYQNYQSQSQKKNSQSKIIQVSQVKEEDSKNNKQNHQNNKTKQIKHLKSYYSTLKYSQETNLVDLKHQILAIQQQFEEQQKQIQRARKQQYRNRKTKRKQDELNEYQIQKQKQLVKQKRKQLMIKLQNLKIEFRKMFNEKIDVQGPSVFCQIIKNKKQKKNIFTLDNQQFRRPKYIDTTYSIKNRNNQFQDAFKQEQFEINLMKKIISNTNVLKQKSMEMQIQTTCA